MTESDVLNVLNDWNGLNEGCSKRSKVQIVQAVIKKALEVARE
jgi:hypothetical protein